MAVAFRSASSGTDLTTALPAGHAQDDVLLAQVTTETDGTTPTAATGWTLIDGVTTCAQVGRPLSCHWYWIARGGSAPATNWSTGGASTPQVSYLCYSGAHTTDPIDDFIKNSTASGADTVWELLTFTNNTDQSMQIAMGGVNQWTTSTSTLANERVDGGATIAAHFYDNGLVGTGSVAAATITCGEGWHNIHLALKPSAGGAPPGEATPAPARVGAGPGGFLSRFAFQWLQWQGVDPPSNPATNALAELAAGTGQAFDAIATVAPTAGIATGTGAANNAKATIAPVAGNAAGTGTAFGSSLTVAPTAGAATGTGTALNPGKTVAPVAGLASGTGAAFDATADTSVITNALAELASGTGAAHNVKATVAPTAGVAAGTGAASNPKATVAPVAEVSAGTGTAFDATADTSTVTNAPAELASGTGAASNAKATIAPSAGAATGTGTAFNASVTITPKAGVATATGTAYGPVCSISVTAAMAAGTGQALDAKCSISTQAELASGTGTAYNASYGAALPPLTPPFAALIVGYTSSTTDVGPRSSTAVVEAVTSTVVLSPHTSTEVLTPVGVT